MDAFCTQMIKPSILLHTVSFGDRILEYIQHWRAEGKDDEADGYEAKRRYCPFLRAADDLLGVIKTRLVDIRHRGAHEKDSDIYKVGRLADRSVVGVKYHGDKNDSQKNSAQLDAPEILSFAKEKALHDGVEEHRHEKQLHVLPRRFVHARYCRDPHRAAKPIV